jgi:hypothetical protein
MQELERGGRRWRGEGGRGVAHILLTLPVEAGPHCFVIRQDPQDVRAQIREHGVHLGRNRSKFRLGKESAPRRDRRGISQRGGAY